MSLVIRISPTGEQRTGRPRKPNQAGDGRAIWVRTIWKQIFSALRIKCCLPYMTTFSIGNKTPPAPGRGITSGHDEAAILKTKPLRKSCNLLIDRHLCPLNRGGPEENVIGGIRCHKHLQNYKMFSQLQSLGVKTYMDIRM